MSIIFNALNKHGNIKKSEVIKFGGVDFILDKSELLLYLNIGDICKYKLNEIFNNRRIKEKNSGVLVMEFKIPSIDVKGIIEKYKFKILYLNQNNVERRLVTEKFSSSSLLIQNNLFFYYMVEVGQLI